MQHGHPEIKGDRLRSFTQHHEVYQRWIHREQTKFVFSSGNTHFKVHEKQSPNQGNMAF